MFTQGARANKTVRSTMRKTNMKGNEKVSHERTDFLHNTAALTSSNLPSCGVHVVSGRTCYCLADMHVPCIVVKVLGQEIHSCKPDQ